MRTSLNEFYFIMVALFKKCIRYTKRTLTLIMTVLPVDGRARAVLPFHYFIQFLKPIHFNLSKLRIICAYHMSNQLLEVVKRATKWNENDEKLECYLH